MGLRINTNVQAMAAHNNLSRTDTSMSKSMEKLTTGLRINRASDDAASLFTSENLRSQVKGLAQAERNAQDGISLINTAEGALNEVTSILQRMRELGVQAANGTLTTSDRAAADAEFQALASEVTNISSYTKFNSLTLFSGTTAGVANGGEFSTFTFQVGANAGQTLTVTMQSITITDLYSGFSSASVGSIEGASAAIASLDSAIATVSELRGKLGAASNRLESVINNVGVSRENLSSAESRIRDTDMAKEMANMSRNQILMQSGTSMLAQANQSSQNVLSLIR